VTNTCPFCSVGTLYSDSLVSVRFDAYPCTTGHMLVTPNRHVASLLDLTGEEYQALFAAGLASMRKYCDASDGWNMGVNIGRASGQTVEHVHLHLIPRRLGDVADPRGGIRWVMPDSAAYWE
jgi:diadenosine tetraphosphate (Ap4A) HIT family hydrolase